jgi:release factor glutamine methyltransferase
VGEQTCTFGPLTIAYDERVLAPRRWTLLQSEWAAELSPTLPDGPILELCAGAGHIGLVAACATGRSLIQVECDPVAAAFAARNACAAGVTDYELRVAPIECAVFAGETFPLVIADPPYLPSDEVTRFPEDPPRAIDGGCDGMTFIRQCIGIAGRHLGSSGVMLLQLRGRAQAERLGVFDTRVFDDDRAVALITRSKIEGHAIG